MTTGTILPILWTENILSAHELALCFSTGVHGRETEKGLHIIAMQSETRVRLLAGKIQRAGGRVDVFPCEAPLDISIASMGQSVYPMILFGAIEYSEWLEKISSESLELKDAIVLAEDLIKHEPESAERSVSLDQLRRRCGVSEYAWDKKYLQPIQLKVTQGANAIGDATEQKRLELKTLSQERDAFKFNDRIIEFCRRTGWSRRDAEQQIRLMKTSITTPKAKRLKGKDFLALETESISWVFPGIIPSRGVFVIGGHAGTGKTTFAYDAVGSLLLREEFLGEKPVRTGKVLLVTGDELPCFTQDKLIDRGIPLDNEDWDILLNWDMTQWDILEEVIADLRPALVVIDSFSSIHRDPNFDENSTQAKNTIYDLEALTNAYNCSCLLIHHLGKSKEAQGVCKLRGSSAIAAAASVVCLMEPMQDGSRKVSFPKMRGAQTEAFVIDLDGESGRYKLLGGGDDKDTKSLAEVVFDFLCSDPYNRFEPSEIAEALGLPIGQRDGIYQALSRLFKRGLVTKRPSKRNGRCKVYGVLKPSELAQGKSFPQELAQEVDPLPPLPVNVSDKNDVINTENTIQTSDTYLTPTQKIPDTYLTRQNDVQQENVCDDQLTVVTEQLTDIGSQRGEGVSCASSEVSQLAQSPVKAQAKIGDRVLVDNCPHADKFGPYLVEEIKGELAKVELFSKLQPIEKLTVVEASRNG